MIVHASPGRRVRALRPLRLGELTIAAGAEGSILEDGAEAVRVLFDGGREAVCTRAELAPLGVSVDGAPALCPERSSR